jgi:hypothetical protein
MYNVCHVIEKLNGILFPQFGKPLTAPVFNIISSEMSLFLRVFFFADGETGNSQLKH